MDADAFEEAAAAARRGREPAEYRSAIQLYAGELLPGDRYEAWTEEIRESLREIYLVLFLDLAGLYERREEYGPAMEALKRVVSEEPTREEAHAGLMRLHFLLGRKGEALKQYERLEKALARELDAEPGAGCRRLREGILSGRFPPAGSPAGDPPPEEPKDAGTHNLPVARDSFVGRGQEIVGVKRALSMTGLLTLTGEGGAGKTRLAVETARELAASYPDGAWLVELAPLADGGLVPQAAASALGVREQPGRRLADTLADALRGKRSLILLDNCEHLIEASASLADTLLGACPRLRILATSREPLGVAGEATWRVPPLSVPGEDASAGDLARYGAVRLFVERARLKLPAFELTSRNARAVAEVCRRLEGVPLAIELASARVSALAVEQVARRLEDSLKLLSGGARTAPARHQTMRATLEWSHDLLTDGEKALFRRLSVFAGGWTLEAAEAVGAGGGVEEGEVLDLLSQLVDKSLIVAEAKEDGASRYRMLEPIRQFAGERLEESGEAGRVRELHARYYLDLAERAEPELAGRDQAAWLERLEREHDNLQAALGWALGREAGPRGSAGLGARLAGALWRFWYKRGHMLVAHRWLEAALFRGGELPAGTRAKALTGAGTLAWERGDYASALALHEESLCLHRQTDNKPGIAASLDKMCLVRLYQGDHASAKALQEESLALRQQLDDVPGRAASLHNLGLVALYRGDYEPAKKLIEESLSLFRGLEDKWSVSILLNNLALAALHGSDHERAAKLQEESLALRRKLGDRVGIAESLEVVSGLAGALGRPSRAVRLWAAAEAMREAIGVPTPRRIASCTRLT